jgi:DNA repair protein RadD
MLRMCCTHGTVRRGKPDSVKVTYYCGLTGVSEWLCPDHGGYAASRYTSRRSALGHLPTQHNRLLMSCSFWITPSRIKVKPSSHDPRFKEIVQLDYSQEKKREKLTLVIPTSPSEHSEQVGFYQLV